MTDSISPAKRSWNMSRIKSKNTSIENKVRFYLKQNNIILRKNNYLPGKPDFCSVKFKIAVFINGCFWHNHGCSRSNIPKSNIEFWKIKLNNTKRRDIKNINKLKEIGYIVFVFWECEINKDIHILDSLVNLYKDYQELF